MLNAYLEVLHARNCCVHDHKSSLARNWTELEVQALWYSGAFGTAFRSVEGRLVEVLQFGFWNREPGPDFIHASIRIDGQTVLHGAIELDFHAADWEHHRHGENPQFNEVILHLFLRGSCTRFFTRTADHREVLQVLLANTPRAIEQPMCSIGPGDCRAPLCSLSDAQVESLLETAAQVRIRRKAEQMQEAVRVHGVDEALFQALAVTLGYKANKIPFLILAQRARLTLLQSENKSIDALLFGLAGFLENERLLNQLPPSANGYVHDLWATWWRFRGQLHHLILPPSQWRFTSTRPQNHPHRRLGALAVIAGSWNDLRLLPPKFSTIETWLGELSHPFWSDHYSLRTSAAKSLQLLGETRVREMVANVFLPMFLPSDPGAWLEFRMLRAELGNKHLELVCNRLFGETNRARAFKQFVYQQQGLLQIFEDFCLGNANGCNECQFPRLIERLTL